MLSRAAHTVWQFAAGFFIANAADWEAQVTLIAGSLIAGAFSLAKTWVLERVAASG